MSLTEVENIYYKTRYKAAFKCTWILAIVIVLLVGYIVVDAKTDAEFTRNTEAQITELEHEVKYYKTQLNELEDLQDVFDAGVEDEK